MTRMSKTEQSFDDDDDDEVDDCDELVLPRSYQCGDIDPLSIIYYEIKMDT